MQSHQLKHRVDSERVKDKNSPKLTSSNTGVQDSETNGSDGKTYREKR